MDLKNYRYSTQPFLAWFINTYFYGQEHFVYCAPFLPYRLNNPKSSNPYELYEDYFKAWKDSDPFDKNIAQMRVNIRKGIMAKHKENTIGATIAGGLKELCDRINIKFFYPIVYRIDFDKVEKRAIKAGSGKLGSDEFLIQDLNSDEFDVLFFDCWQEEKILHKLFLREDDLTQSELLISLEEYYADAV